MRIRQYDSYDYGAIIIGTGIGGHVAGTYTREGVRVLLCEQHIQPGGYFTSFKRKSKNTQSKANQESESTTGRPRSETRRPIFQKRINGIR